MTFLFGRPETRSVAGPEASERLSAWGRGDNVALMGDSPADALRLIPVYSAVAGIAEDIATTPVRAYRDTGDGTRSPLGRQPEWLATPAPWGGRIPWLHQALTSLLLRGNAYGVVVATGSNGWPSKIVWQHPDRVTVTEKVPGMPPEYRVGNVPVPAESMVHIPAFVLPGSFVGLSPVSLFRVQLTKSHKAQQYAADFFDRGIMPPGVLKNTQQTISAAQARLAKSRFKAAVADRDIFVTGSDWEWTALQVPKDDAAFLEAIQAGATEIAAIFRVAPEDIGGKAGGSLTYSTVELNELKRNRRTLLPWTRRLEESLTACLPRPQYVRFNLDALARADLKTRMEAHEIALRTGMETNAEGRALEERPPLTSDEIAEWQANYRSTSPTITVTAPKEAP